MTGGPNTECTTCPNYEYEDLVDYYWPALIAGVERYSGENIIQYVGHSNGCRVALDSLKNWSSSGKNDAGYYFDSNTGTYKLTDLASSPVDTFVGVGCPGVFNGTSRFTDQVAGFKDDLIKYLDSGVSHPTQKEIGLRLQANFFEKRALGDDKISSKLMKNYLTFVTQSDDKIPGKTFSINKLFLLAGDSYPFKDSTGQAGIDDDGFVLVSDIKQIFNSITKNEGNVTIVHAHHGEQTSNNEVNKIIRGNLK